MRDDEPIDKLIENAQALHDQSMKLLVGILLRGKPVPIGMSREEAIEILKQDVTGSRRLLARFGRSFD